MKALVTFYKYDQEKNFGFLSLENGETAYFNTSKRHQPTFDGSDIPQLLGWRTHRTPQKNDQILVFNTKKGQQGLYVMSWVFEDEYNAVLAQITTRSTYRLLRQIGHKRYGKLTPHGWEPPVVLWEGKNLQELRERYPVSTFPVRDNDNYRVWFEVQNEKWQKVADPRIT